MRREQSFYVTFFNFSLTSHRSFLVFFVHSLLLLPNPFRNISEELFLHILRIIDSLFCYDADIICINPVNALFSYILSQSEKIIFIKNPILQKGSVQFDMSHQTLVQKLLVQFYYQVLDKKRNAHIDKILCHVLLLNNVAKNTSGYQSSYQKNVEYVLG